MKKDLKEIYEIMRDWWKTDKKDMIVTILVISAWAIISYILIFVAAILDGAEF